MILTPEKTVRDIAIENPNTIRVFESLGIDYCCGGRHRLDEACEQANVPLSQAIELIAASRDGHAPVQKEWADSPLADLIDHIVGHHHSSVRAELPRLEVLLDKVHSRHGNLHPELESLHDLLRAISQELLAHMLKEEQILFPYIESMETAAFNEGPHPVACFPTVEMPIARMLTEHDDAGALLFQIRKLTRDFHPPEDACPSYRGLYHSLEEFERELHLHIHLENNILFPRAVEMERGLK